MTRKIGITDTILRDAHQSLMATRMRIEDMLPVLDQLDEAGFASLECWGGATFDACIRFLDEDPGQTAHLEKTFKENTVANVITWTKYFRISSLCR